MDIEDCHLSCSETKLPSSETKLPSSETKFVNPSLMNSNEVSGILTSGNQDGNVSSILTAGNQDGNVSSILTTTRGHIKQNEDWIYETFAPVPMQQVVPDDKLYAAIMYMIKNKSNNKNTPEFRKNFGMISNTELLYYYVKLVRENKIERVTDLEITFKNKANRMASGVFVFTVVMSDKPDGQDFTCKWDCHYCPKPPNMPRSYLEREPAVARGYSFNWDVVMQIRNRMKAYMTNGLIPFLGMPYDIIKGEFIIEGGTYTSYPEKYRERFMTEMYYACNTIYDSEFRPVLSLEEEIAINENNRGIRVVGLSIETRPDTVNPALCRELRRFGVTKIQIGVQSTFDSVLDKVNRGCKHRHTEKATRILAEHCFKVQVHIMPDLPGSNMDMDKQMFDTIFNSTLVIDAMKVYPCMVLDYTEISNWYATGAYRPYGNDPNKMMEVLLYMTESMKQAERFDIRIERVIRDVPAEEIRAGCKDISMGNTLTRACNVLGTACICIRCRECARHDARDVEPKLYVRCRTVDGGVEYFISLESDDAKVLYGFLRLRIDNMHSKYFPELNNTAKIRELHVYNNAVPVGESSDVSASAASASAASTSAASASAAQPIQRTQHRGYGTKLLHEAERIANKVHNMNRICVISGVGVRGFYKKVGFINGENYLIKHI